MNVIRLAAGALRAEVAPEAGGSLAGFWTEGEGGHRTDWLRSATPQALARREPLGMASFPLVPFCNRIRDGRASFEGREIRFPPNHPAIASPHPLHGIGWQRAWQVTRGSGHLAELALAVEASPAWPWRFSARQRISLDGRSLSVEIGLTNEDALAMPAGIGHHPYLPRTPGTRLTTACGAMWQTDGEVMPTGLETDGVVDDLRAGALLEGLVLDNNFVGWERAARIDWRQDPLGPARHLVLQADAPLDYFVVYSPAQADHFCAEPVSQCTDWINLVDRFGHGALGGARLAPGETLAGQFSLTPAWGS